MAPTRKQETEKTGPAATLRKEGDSDGSLVPQEPNHEPLASIAIDATEIARQANVLDTLGEIKEIIEGAACDLQITDQNTLTREPGREVFQATRSVRINKPARLTLPSVTPWTLALVLGSLAIVAIVLVLVL